MNGRAKTDWTAHYEGMHFVYFISDLRRRLLYIGCTGDLVQREASHNSRGAYKRDEVEWEIEGPFRTRVEALYREAYCIQRDQPPGNVEHLDGQLVAPWLAGPPAPYSLPPLGGRPRYRVSQVRTPTPSPDELIAWVRANVPGMQGVERFGSIADTDVA